MWEQRAELVEDRLVDRLAAERDLLQRQLPDGLPRPEQCLPPEGGSAGHSGDAVLESEFRPAVEFGGLDKDHVLTGVRQ